MVVLLVVVIGSVFAVAIFAKLLVFGLGMASVALARIPSLPRRLLGWSAYLAAVGAASYLSVPAALKILPDFRTKGDGGFGMAFNAVAAVASSVACVGAISILLSWLLLTMIKSASDGADIHDPFSDLHDPLER